MVMHFVAILENGASKLFRRVPDLLRVIIVFQNRPSARGPLESRSLAVSGGRVPSAA